MLAVVKCGAGGDPWRRMFHEREGKCVEDGTWEPVFKGQTKEIVSP